MMRQSKHIQTVLKTHGLGTQSLSILQAEPAERGPLTPRAASFTARALTYVETAWTPALIRAALERMRTVDVDRWLKAHLGDSLLAKRRQALIPVSPILDTKTA